jgi:hypothetical protein
VWPKDLTLHGGPLENLPYHMGESGLRPEEQADQTDWKAEYESRSWDLRATVL